MSKSLVQVIYRLLIYLDKRRLLVSFFVILTIMYICHSLFAFYLDAFTEPGWSQSILSTDRMKSLSTFLPEMHCT